MYCSECGQLIKNESAAFCAYCGSRVNKKETEAEAVSESVQVKSAVHQEEIDDLDATLRVEDISERKYTLTNDSFSMPEPEEESVFDVTPLKDEYDTTDCKGTAGEEKSIPFEGSGLYYPGQRGAEGYPGIENPDMTIRSRRASPDTAFSGTYPGAAYASSPEATRGAYPLTSAGMQYTPQAAACQIQNNRPDSFAQAGSGPDNFFVQQKPVSAADAGKEKLAASKLVLLIVLCVVLFALAVAGGIFAATAVMNNLMISGTASAVKSFIAAAIYI